MTKKKSFDCVEMKRKAQKRLQSEYEARKGEFSSYAEFITATASQSPETHAFLEKVRRAGKNAIHIIGETTKDYSDQ